MGQEKYKKNIVSNPRHYTDFPYHKNRAQGFVVYLDSSLMENNPAVVDGPGCRGWNKELQRTEIPYPDPITDPHSHPYDQFLFYIGSDPDNPQDLGAEIEITLGDEIYTFDKSAVVYIPKDVIHTERHLRLDRHYFGLGFQPGNTSEYE